ncbi:MAG: hypothetical protein WC242_02145 [Candidatus Paceibacterota bacterium]|jgi:hypothetical protein
MANRKIEITKSIKNFLGSVLVTFKMMELIMFYCLFYIDCPIYVDHENATVYAKTEKMTKKKRIRRSVWAYIMSTFLFLIALAIMSTPSELFVVGCILGIMSIGLNSIAYFDLTKVTSIKA